MLTDLRMRKNVPHPQYSVQWSAPRYQMHPRPTRVSPPTSDELEPSLISKHTLLDPPAKVCDPPTPDDVDPLLEIKIHPSPSEV